MFDSQGDEVDGLLKDPNGNEITMTTSGQYSYFHDPLGNDPNGNPALTETGSGTEASPIVFTYTGPGGTQAVVTEKFAAQNVNGSPCGAWSGSPELPVELDLPDGTKYNFTYDILGRLTQVALPTGAVIHYGYVTDCTDYGNSELTRADTLDPYSWNWARTQKGGGAVQTTETSPGQNDSVFSFAAPYWNGESGALTEADFYQGTGGSRTELESLAYSNTLSYGYVVGQDLTDALYQGGTASRWRNVAYAWNNFGNQLTETDTDWGTCPDVGCGAYLRGITTTFTTLLNGVMTVPTEVTVSAYNGTAAQIVYGYDSNNGNLLTEQDYSSASTSLTKSYTYNGNGTLATATDPNSGVTTYTYGACNGAFPTEVKGPITAAQDTKMTWDCVGGVMLSSTDVNGWTTHYNYAGPGNTWQLNTIEAPDGQYWGFQELSSTNPNQTEVWTTFGGCCGDSSAIDVVTTMDGLGRPILSQRRQAAKGQSGGNYFDTVQTAYDSMDRAVSVTEPYTGTQGQIAPNGTPATTTTYDALSRPLAVSDAGGGYVSYAYTLNDVLKTVGPAPAGESVKQVQSEFDGLGRLASVCEVTAGTQAWPGGACAQQSPMTGYWTKYTRNGAGAITQVVQNAQSSSNETRTYAFDWLGRLTSETNPENGATAYTFDTDPACGTSSGDLVKRVDAAGNVTCYAHDPAHRVTSISYPSGPNAAATPAKTFIYDAATVDGTAMQNVGGRLAEAYTGNHITDLGFSYPAAYSRQTTVYQSSPNSGGWYVTGAYFFETGPMSILTMPGLPAPVYWGIDGEGRLSSASENGTTLVGPATYSAFGLMSQTLGSVDNDTDTWSYDPNTGRMQTYQFTVAGNTDTGTLSWNANGSLQQLAIQDNIPGTGDSETCTYAHDDLGRLQSAQCGALWGQTFAFDPFGNLGKTASAGTSFSASFNLSNQIASAGGVAGIYDSDGNLLNDPTQNTSQVNQFDAEGRPVRFENAGVTYDALGRAVEATGTPSGTVEFLYGPDGRKLAVMNGQALVRADVPLPGGDVAAFGPGGLSYFAHADWLGSSRLQTRPDDGTLWWSNGIAPYGEGYSASAVQYLTGQDADIAFQNFDFPAREYSPVQGRWWTPDPAGLSAVNPGNPQSWNRYAYVNGTPLRATDPLGLLCVDSQSPTEEVTNPDGSAMDQGECEKAGQLWQPDQSVEVDAGPQYAPLIGVPILTSTDAGGDNVSNPAASGEGKGLWACLGQAAEQNGVALALDSAAVATDLAGPEAQYARLGISAGLATAAMVNSAAMQDETGTVLGVVSYNRAATEFAGTAGEYAWAKYVPIVGGAVDFLSLLRDAKRALSSFGSCRARDGLPSGD